LPFSLFRLYENGCKRQEIILMQTPKDLRRLNQQNLLKLIYFNEPISRLELSKLSNLSPATVTNLVSNILGQGLGVPAGFEESSGGRPRETLRINPDYGYFIGIEAAETHIYTELFDIKLNRIGNVRFELSPEDNDLETIVHYIVQGVREVHVQAAISKNEIIGAGIGLPGIVNREGGVSVFAPNWGWKNIPLLDMLRDKLDINFQLDNALQALALAEAHFGAGRGISEVAVLLIGTGVGAGIILEDQLWRGVTNSAGEWGHTCLDLHGPPCRCGSYGCVETFVGALGIIRHLQQLDPNSPLLNPTSQKKTIRALCRAALDGDPVATQVLDDVTLYLGAGVANLLNLVNPRRIVVGGWCGALLNPYVLPRLKSAVEKYALHGLVNATEFVASELGGEGISLGAASLVLETFLAGELRTAYGNLIGVWEPN
jgi:predicted NBD/HSP70 family sugar kinase